MAQKKGPKGGAKKKKPITLKSGVVNEEGRTVVDMAPHKHCLNCGVSIPEDSETCSDKCKAEWDKIVSRKKFWAYLPFLGAGFLLLLWMIFSLAG